MAARGVRQASARLAAAAAGTTPGTAVHPALSMSATGSDGTDAIAEAAARPGGRWSRSPTAPEGAGAGVTRGAAAEGASPTPAAVGSTGHSWAERPAGGRR